MRLWRLCRAPFADLSGEGGRLFDGRWHSAGRPLVYTATEPSLAVLEVRVHLDLPFALLPDDYVLMQIDAGGLTPEFASLPADPHDCRRIGDDWLAAARSALLSVPSVIVPEARNVLVNPRHPDAVRVSITGTRALRFDPRLFR